MMAAAPSEREAAGMAKKAGEDLGGVETTEATLHLIQVLATVIPHLLLGVRQHRVRLTDFLELHFLSFLLFLRLAGMAVWMMEQRVLLIRLLDFILCGVLGDFQELVVIFPLAFLQFNFGFLEETLVF